MLGRLMGIGIEDRNCMIIGPAKTVAAALELLDANTVDGAVLDASLLDRDVTPVAFALIDKGIPFVIHTGVGMPEELGAVYPQISIIMKPADPDEVVRQLIEQIEKLGLPSTQAERLAGHSPDSERFLKQVDHLASALFGQFGERALILARRQSVGATGEALKAWNSIIDNLIRRSASKV